MVDKFDFNKPDVHEIHFLLDDIIKGCRNKYFHTFDYRLVYDMNFRNSSNNEETSFPITHRSMDFKTEFYSFNKKIKNAQSNGFLFNQIIKLTKEIYSNLSKKIFNIISNFVYL